jgi:gliding motility-associated lipoprotein GldD
MKRQMTKNKLLLLVLLGVTLASCGKKEQVYPKPYGFFRLQMPKDSFVYVDSLPFFTCSIPSYAHFEKKVPREKNWYWWDLVFPSFKAKVNLSYRRVDKNFYQLSEEARDFVYKHTQKANGIQDSLIYFPEFRLYGMIYRIEGQYVASPFQFFVSDSVYHYLRGALYFEHVPNNDSIQPFIDRVRHDIEKCIFSIRWKK